MIKLVFKIIYQSYLMALGMVPNKKFINKAKTRMKNQIDLKERTIARLVKRGGLRNLIYAKCVDCIFDQTCKGTHVQQIRECSVTDCPLYNQRLSPGLLRHSQAEILEGGGKNPGLKKIFPVDRKTLANLFKIYFRAQKIIIFFGADPYRNRKLP